MVGEMMLVTMMEIHRCRQMVFILQCRVVFCRDLHSCPSILLRSDLLCNSAYHAPNTVLEFLLMAPPHLFLQTGAVMSIDSFQDLHQSHASFDNFPTGILVTRLVKALVVIPTILVIEVMAMVFGVPHLKVLRIQVHLVVMTFRVLHLKVPMDLLLPKGHLPQDPMVNEIRGVKDGFRHLRLRPVQVNHLRFGNGYGR